MGNTSPLRCSFLPCTLTILEAKFSCFSSQLALFFAILTFASCFSKDIFVLKGHMDAIFYEKVVMLGKRGNEGYNSGIEEV